MEEFVPYLKEGLELVDLKRLRRKFHQYPELGFTEFWTSVQICDFLNRLGFDLTFGKDLYSQALDNKTYVDQERMDKAYRLAKEKIPDNPWLEKMKGGFTGVIANLKGTGEGPRIGFRFDIDGLPIHESSEHHHRPFAECYASRNSNMHACGHDGHIAIGLGLAKRIKAYRDSLKGDFYFIFQPAEELALGARLFSELDIFRNLEYFIPIHLGLIDQRKIICGLSFLAKKEFYVTFKGLSTHAGASPEVGNNALLAACSTVNHLYGISRHGGGISRINVGKFRSDNPSNVISDDATFELELRGQTSSVCEYLAEKAKNIIEGAALMHNVKAQMTYKTETIANQNDDDMVDLVKEAAGKAGIKEGAVLNEYLCLGSEDATFLMQEVQKHGGQATFVCLGSPTYGGHHNPAFDFDEDMLLWGVRILWEYTKIVSIKQR